MRCSPRCRGPPGPPRTGATPATSGSSWVTSLRLAPVSVTASGMPAVSQIRWCLEPVRPRSTGDGPVKAPLKSTYVTAVGDRRGPVDRPGRVEALKQRLVRALSHARPLRVAQAPPRGHARAAHLAGQMPPRDPRDQHKHDRVKRHSIRHARSSRRGRLDRRQQRLDDLPDLVAPPKRHWPPPLRVMSPEPASSSSAPATLLKRVLRRALTPWLSMSVSPSR